MIRKTPISHHRYLVNQAMALVKQHHMANLSTAPVKQPHMASLSTALVKQHHTANRFTALVRPPHTVNQDNTRHRTSSVRPVPTPNPVVTHLPVAIQPSRHRSKAPITRRVPVVLPPLAASHPRVARDQSLLSWSAPRWC